MPKKAWIQAAIKKPGSFTHQAELAHMKTDQFAKQVLAHPYKYKPVTVRRARLAQTLAKLRKHNY